MIKVQRTYTLDTPEAVADHIHEEFERRTAEAPFRCGDRVRITRRDDIPDGMMVGDVGTVLLCDPLWSQQSTLMGVNEAGTTIQFPVLTANLERA